MMMPINDSEIHEIVKRVLARVNEPAVPSAISSNSVVAAESLKQKTEQKKVVAIGSDHGGFDLKESLKTYLKELGFEVVDCGCPDKNAVDYPDFAHAVATMIAAGTAWRGVMIDGAGIGSCMVGNKVPGVRAALCYDYATAVNSREHNDANMLTLGAGLIGINLAKQIVKTWLETAYAGGRHKNRIDKLLQIERSYLKTGS